MMRVKDLINLKFLRYVFVGGVIVVITLLVRYVFNFIFSFVFSVFLSEVVAVLLSFFANGRYVFKVKMNIRMFIAFILINTFNISVAMIVADLSYIWFMKNFDTSYIAELKFVAHFLAIVISGSSNFVLHSLISYRVK